MAAGSWRPAGPRAASGCRFPSTRSDPQEVGGPADFLSRAQIEAHRRRSQGGVGLSEVQAAPVPPRLRGHAPARRSSRVAVLPPFVSSGGRGFRAPRLGGEPQGGLGGGPESHKALRSRVVPDAGSAGGGCAGDGETGREGVGAALLRRGRGRAGPGFAARRREGADPAAAEGKAKMSQALRRFLTGGLILVVRSYQWLVSPVLGLVGVQCRFEPSCSAYMIEAIRKDGPWRGVGRGLARLGRCHPWHPGGYDPP